jgi:hypothetical protein
VIYLLQKGPLTRSELLEGFQTRFGVKQKKADALIKAEQFKSEDEPIYLKESMRGHEKVFEIDWESANGAGWGARVEHP